MDLVFPEAFIRLKWYKIQVVLFSFVLGLRPLLSIKICLYFLRILIPPFPVASIKDISPRRDLVSRVYDRDFPFL